MQFLLYILFILSGAAGLIYESIWSRYLGLFVGHSAYAQIIVIAIFLGGMSLGALLIGRKSESVQEPLALYAYIEMAVGLMGLVFHPVFSYVTTVAYDSIFPSLAGSPVLLPVKWLIAALLILPQSILLGMTFPLMSAGVIRLIRQRPGRVLSLLYFSNSLGAAGGVLLAGFVLIRIAGLAGTLYVAAMINIVVGVGALAAIRYLIPWQLERAARRAEAAASAQVVVPVTGGDAIPLVEDTEQPATDERIESLWKLLLAVSFGTAVASFIYEIAWIRMLSMVLGSATHSFELMLSAFILGLALGAFWMRKRADTVGDAARTLGIVQWVMGAAALATLPLYLMSFSWTASLMGAVSRTDTGYNIFSVARYVFCLAVMLPSTFCAGMTLPLITRTLVASPRGERSIGMVYGVNTLGSIVGVAAAGLILMPLLGAKYMLIFGACLDMALGVALLAYTGTDFNWARPRVALATGGLALAAIIASSGVRFDQILLSSGVFRTGAIPFSAGREVLYFKDGRTATVTVSRLYADSLVVIATNGKPDASLDAPWFRTRTDSVKRQPLHSDISTQLLLPMITLAHAPQARVAAVIGHGSGMSSHFLLGSPVLEDLYTIEIEPAMIEGARNFYPANERVFDDPRSHFIIDDAKSYFAASGQRFDLILSEPSNPWVSGVSGLFTTEFYSRVKRYLADDGVFGQWLHLYEISDGLVLSVLAALHQNFPSYDIFQTSGGDILIVASLREQLPTADWSVFEFPDIRRDLYHATPFDSLTLEATRVLSRPVLGPLLDNWGQANSDFFPVLDLGSEKTRFLRESATGFSAMWTQGFNVSAAFMNRRAGPGDEQLAVMPGLGSIYSRAMSARARRGGVITAEDSTTYPGLEEFNYRRWMFEATLATDEPPADWRRWAADFVRVEEDLHRGTAGFIDSGFYSTVERFIERRNAPAEVRQSVRFLRGVAEWNFAAVALAADSLTAMGSAGTAILSPDFVRDGGVVAKLRLGDVQGARELYNKLVNMVFRSPAHFQTRLLEAHVRAAEAEERRRVNGNAGGGTGG